MGVSNAELESAERQRAAEQIGANKVGELTDRQMARLRGTITELTVKPREGMPWLEAELSDGSGSITLIWMGRREIPGVIAGRQMVVSGRVSCVDGHRSLYNPRYDLIAD
ncbi:MAG: OB-fold nucleic acid binding domain-containing protein [Propionicimonas sp.]